MVDKETLQAQANGLKNEIVGHMYRHFKGGLYVVDNIAVHSEEEGLMVIYHTAADTQKVWARPYDMFISEVDHKKYPDVVQQYRFEKIK